MAIFGGTVGYRLLRWLSPAGKSNNRDDSAYQSSSKLEALFGPSIWDDLSGKVVIDFGCGTGGEAAEMAARGAARVIGIDIRESVLAQARLAANGAGVADRCLFTTETNEQADLVVSLDAFEHFADPAHILSLMRRLLKDDGQALIAFGPPWYHPRGGHTFSVFPWAHLLFTEQALLRWRADFKADRATRFSEVDGGLNQMTVRRFRRLVSESDFEFVSFEAVPIRKLRHLTSKLSRECLTSFVRCRLRKQRTGSMSAVNYETNLSYAHGTAL
ncbi:MAG: class I SAM-dependent methyltransferase [Gemmataceae bacterium]